MGASLEGPIAKLMRADRQLAELKDEVWSIWSPRKTWPVRSEEDRGGLEHRFYLGELPAIDPDWALRAGEIMFNLRSALDHLIWQLHVRHYGRRAIPQKVEFASQFPIFDSPVDFRRRGQRRIMELGKREQRTIRHLQPYNRRHDQWQHVRADLSDLNTLHNIDKHRKLHVVASAQAAVIRQYFPPSEGFQPQTLWGPLESHSQIERWTFTSPPTYVKHHGFAMLKVALEHRGKYPELITLLGGFLGSVRRVLRNFEGRFPPAAWPPIDERLSLVVRAP